MNFPPEVWGPFFWHTIHIVALGYSNNPTYSDKKAAKDFFESLQHLIPCSICKSHYVQHFKNNPITPSLDSRADLIQWTINIHNEVNKMLNKPTWTRDEVIAYYTRLGASGRSPVWTANEFAAADSKALAYGVCLGAAGSLIAAGAVMWSLGLLPTNN
jgi:hypothetical protein